MSITVLQSWMLLLFVVVNFSVQAAGSRIGTRNQDTEIWFQSLRKPRGYPAEWIFAPIWTLVAIATGIAGWLIWQQGQAGAPATALVLYGFCLGFNALWQGMAIGQRWLGMGLAFAWLLWGSIALTMLYAAASGGWTWVWLIPYWLWVAYCLSLNQALWRMNRVLLLPALPEQAPEGAPQPAPEPVGAEEPASETATPDKSGKEPLS